MHLKKGGKIVRRILIIIGFVVLFTGTTITLALACNCGKTVKDENAMPPSCQCSADSCGGEEGMASAEAVQVNNTVCPVSGKPIGSMGDGVTSTYQGKTYRLCCGGCVAQFKAEPEKYVKKIQESK